MIWSEKSATFRDHALPLRMILSEKSATFRDHALAHHVGPQLRGIGFRIAGGEFGGFVDDLADIGVHPLELILARPAGGHEPRPHLLDRIVLGADLLDLLA